MSIVYTADIFCDGDGCSEWTNGLSSTIPPLKHVTRRAAPVRKGWVLGVNGNDYCPKCALLPQDIFKKDK